MKYLMLAGIPTSGKSTFVRQLFEDPYWQTATILSTDNFIADIANQKGLSYDEVFEESYPHAAKKLEQDLQNAVKNKIPIIHDQTNLTVKARVNKLKKIPDHYNKIIVYSSITLEEALKRNNYRPGKVIPQNVLTSMYNSFQVPTCDEGFDLVVNMDDQNIVKNI